MQEYNLLNVELKKFWNWANMSFDEYIINRGSGEWETDYEKWNIIYDCINNIISYINDNDIIDKRFYMIILEGMAIDNEAEIIKETCVDNLKKLHLLIEHGYKHRSSQVRWQIADIITDNKCNKNENILKMMFENENDKYVIRKILLALSKIKSNKVEDYAFQKLKDADEYVRLIAIRILKEFNSSLLNKAYDILKNDTSKLIKKEIEI